METFYVRILQMRRSVGIKEISAPSIEVTESYITMLLKQYLNLETVSEKVYYLHRTSSGRKLKLQIGNYTFAISLLPLFQEAKI